MKRLLEKRQYQLASEPNIQSISKLFEQGVAMLTNEKILQSVKYRIIV